MSAKDTRDPPKTDQGTSWGGWLSSFANSAYDSVLGDSGTAPAPETYEDLRPEVATSRDGQEPNAFSKVDSASRQALWKQLLSVIGMDVMNMRLSLPIWLFEPSTALTRMCETFQFFEVLDRAAAEKDPILRDSLVAAFVISAFAHTERVRKPFNPVLGETFQYQDKEHDFSFFAEQVSHHPPISVSRCDGKGWNAAESVDVKATYMGNSIHVSNSGPMAARSITLKESNDHYTWTLPKAVVSNLFIGGTFIDHFGQIELLNHTTGTRSMLTLTKAGWFSSGRYRVTGELLDPSDTVVARYEGLWNKYMDCERTQKAHGQGSMRLWIAGKHLLPESEGGGPSGPLPNFTKFGAKILALDDELKKSLHPSDSRLRPDRIALQKEDTVEASNQKLFVEQAQRDRAKKLEAEGACHVPKWFRCTDQSGVQAWIPKGSYDEVVQQKAGSPTDSEEHFW